MGLTNPAEERAYAITQHSGNPQYPSCLIAKRIKGELSSQHLHAQQVIVLHLAQQQYIWKVSSAGLPSPQKLRIVVLCVIRRKT